jgi:hypothetical protein
MRSKLDSGSEIELTIPAGVTYARAAGRGNQSLWEKGHNVAMGECSDLVLRAASGLAAESSGRTKACSHRTGVGK